MNTKKSTFDYSPSLLEYEGNFVRINFDVEKIELTNETNGMNGSNGMNGNDSKDATRTAYAAYVVRIEQPVERDKVVNAIVVSAYPTDKMQAIINNHFANLAVIADGGKLDADEEEHEAEYEAMQAWRTKAKGVAMEVMLEYNRTH